MNAWTELYYSLFGLVRNEIRTGHDAKTRIDHIEKVLEDHRLKHRALEKVEDGEGNPMGSRVVPAFMSDADAEIETMLDEGFAVHEIADVLVDRYMIPRGELVLAIQKAEGVR